MRHYAGSALMLIFTMIAAIGSYTVNLRVSSERAAVESLRRQLVSDAREIRTLQVELRTRARFPEMQRWNDGVFQMSAPAASQYLRDPLQLASYGAEPKAPAQAKPELQYAVTGPATVTVPTSGVVTASYTAPAARTAPETARLIRAGYTAAPKASVLGDAPPPTLTIAPTAAPAPRAEAPAAAPAKRVAMLDAPAKPKAPKPVAAKPVRLAPVAAPAPAAGGPIDLLPDGGH